MESKPPYVTQPAPDALVISPQDDILDALEDVITQACSRGETVDSMSFTSYAYAMRLLSRYGRLKVDSDLGRRVIGRFIQSQPAPAAPSTPETTQTAQPFSEDILLLLVDIRDELRSIRLSVGAERGTARVIMELADDDQSIGEIRALVTYLSTNRSPA